MKSHLKSNAKFTLAALILLMPILGLSGIYFDSGWRDVVRMALVFCIFLAVLVLLLSAYQTRKVRENLSSLMNRIQKRLAGEAAKQPAALPDDGFGELEEFIGATLSRMQSRIEELEGGIRRDREAMDRLRSLSTAVEQNPASIAITDLKANILYVNPRFVEVSGYTPREVIGKNPRILQSGQTPPETFTDMWAKLTHGEVWQGELWNRRKDGEVFCEETLIAPVRDDSGAIRNYVAVKLDISARKQFGQEFDESKRRYRFLFDNSPLPMLVVADIDQRVLDVNDTAVKHYGYTADEFRALTLRDIHPEEERGELDRAIAFSSSGKIEGEWRHIRKSGSQIHVVIQTSPMQYGAKSAHIVVIEDITLRKDIEEKIRRMAHYDTLTELPNRVLFTENLKHALAVAKRDRRQFAVMFLDLDKFKPINDNLGHAVGDWLLAQAARRMQDCVRESDIVARIGGDEFVVLLPVIKTEQDALSVAEKVRNMLNQPFMRDEHRLEISASIGVALYPEHGTDEDHLLRCADIAMYQSKENGRDRVTLYQDGMLGLTKID